jgi:hypothetical protein
MAQSLLNGHLPYTQLWDNKPPLAFAFYSAVIEVFGKSLVGISHRRSNLRTCYCLLVYLIGKRICSKRSGLIAALISIPAMSLITDASRRWRVRTPWTEHVALVPLMGALYLLICNDKSLKNLFFIGVLMATTTLIRMNMAYAVVVVGLYIAIRSWRLPWTAFKRAACYAAGGGLIALLTCLPYLLTGHFDELWISAHRRPVEIFRFPAVATRNLVEQTLQSIGIYVDASGRKFDFHFFQHIHVDVCVCRRGYSCGSMETLVRI